MALGDYAQDPPLLGRVLELLGLVFAPGFAEREREGRRWGLRWERCSVPFVLEQDGLVVAHVGVMAIPAVLEGEHRTVGAVHAVSVHPDHRGHGHMRHLMEEALEWCDQRFETCALAGDPALYERFGFRYLPEHRFVGRAPEGATSAAAPPRLCSIDDPGDVALWQRLLTGRTPVSDRAGIRAESDVFCFDAVGLPIRHAQQLDALLDFTCEDGTLRLYDVVASRIPSLAELVAAVGQPVERVEAYFAPDLLGADLSPEPHDLGAPDDPDTWMVRGPWTSRPFLWPRTARW